MFEELKKSITAAKGSSKRHHRHHHHRSNPNAIPGESTMELIDHRTTSPAYLAELEKKKKHKKHKHDKSSPASTDAAPAAPPSAGATQTPAVDSQPKARTTDATERKELPVDNS